MVSVRPNLISPLSGCGRSSPKLFKLCIYFLGRQQIYVSRASLPIRKYLRASKSQHLPTGAPQYQIGKDRVDFAVFVNLLAPEEIKIIVECDQTSKAPAKRGGITIYKITTSAFGFSNGMVVSQILTGSLP
jgi:hypothetical protein